MNDLMRFCTFLLLISCTEVWAGDEYGGLRLGMVELIKDDVRATSLYIGMNSLSPRVMEAMATVERHKFVPEKQLPYAYENRPLSIGHGQTISQPYIVAIMTELLNITDKSKVLEVGTGSGYQAAVLAYLTREVYTIEIIQPLAVQAEERLTQLGFTNVHTRLGDGYYGWEEHGPFDGIIVTAASSTIPPPLIQQLRPGGRMIIPVGSRFLTQQLMLVTKDEDGVVMARQILPVRFVPLTGDHD